MALGSEFQLTIECKQGLGSRNRRFHWTCVIRLQLGIPLPLMYHGQKHHFWPREETMVLLCETHYNFCNGGSKAIKWTMRAYGKIDHLSHAYAHLL